MLCWYIAWAWRSHQVDKGLREFVGDGEQAGGA
jgi:hypothetical protein